VPELQTPLQASVAIDGHTRRQLARLGIVTLIVYVLFSYGGIRTPDGEVVFRTAEALATNGTFAVNDRIQGLTRFGLPAGKDGRYYSLFGPGQAVLAVPFVELGLLIDKSGWYKSVPQLIPISFYVDNGLVSFVQREIPTDPEPHALRFLVCFFNCIVGALSVCIFFLLARLIARSDFSAYVCSVLFAFGTLFMPYCGTFFSEPLATLFVILSFYCLVRNDVSDETAIRQKYITLLAAGLFLGTAMTVHLTAALFAPTFFLYGLYPSVRIRPSFKKAAISGTLFIAGCGVFLALLAYFNYVRFGNILETGRSVNPDKNYSMFGTPWQGIFGLLFSSGKGILWYCPAALLSILIWRPFHKRYPAISSVILGSVLLRLFFIASYSDWHGGFSLGPRFLVMAVPLMILPFGETIARWLEKRMIRHLWTFAVFIFLCVTEQIYFSVGEIFSFLHIVKWTYRNHGIDVFLNNALYLDWDKSPLLYLLNTMRGPFLMKFLPMSNYALFAWCVGVTGVIIVIWYATMLKKYAGRWR
jgi:hypothetical protein